MDEKRRCTTNTEISDEIIHPSHTSKQYKPITLKNGLSVLLVADKETSQAAAAMTVRVGSFLDPPELPGLSHLLEHMVFMGSHQFPGDNELKDFLSKHGGDADASTKMEHSTFYMRVENSYLRGALKRFAQLFIQPLMKIEHIEKEINTIDSEFELHKQSDDCRLDQLMAHTSTKGHPFNRFTWGNKVSLSTNELSMGSLQNRLLKLFNECFVASSMQLVVVGDAPFCELEIWVTDFFSPLKKGSQSFPKSNPRTRIWDSDYLYVLESVGQRQALHVSWMIHPISYNTCLERPENLLVQLFSQETKGSLFSLLKEKGWITELSVCVGSNPSFSEEDGDNSYSCTSLGRLFTIVFDITDEGLKEKYQLITYIYQYLQLVRSNHPPPHVMSEYWTTQKMKFECLDIDPALVNDPCLFAQRLAGNMLKCPVRHVVSLDFMNQTCTNEAIEELLEHFTPEYMRIDVFSKSLKAKEFQTEPWFDSSYIQEKIPASFKETWSNISEVDSSLHYPRKNEFMPSGCFSLRNVKQSEDNVEEVTRESEEEQSEDDAEQSEDDAEQSYLFVDEPFKRLFYKREEGLSSAFFCLDMKVGVEVKNHMMTVLFVKLLKDDLSEIIFKGSEAYLNASLSLRDDNRLELKFDGYREKLHLFIETIWKKFTSFLPTLKRFEIIRETVVRDFYTKLLDLSEQSDQLVSEVILKGCYAFDVKFEALKTITFDDLLQFIPVLRSVILIEGICFGDLLEDEAMEISEVVTPALPTEIYDGLILVSKLKRGVLRRDVKALNDSEANSLAMVYFQLPCKKNELHRVTALLHLFNSMIEEEVWRLLRQEERLGYDVQCQPDSNCAIKSLSITVVSSEHDPEYLLSRIDKCIEGIGVFLKGIGKKTFRDYKEGVLSTLPDDRGKFLWQLIVEGSYLDGFHLKLRKSLREMAKQDVIEFYKKYFEQSLTRSPRKLEVCIRGCKTETPAVEE